MAQPPAYTPSFDFSDFEGTNPDDPKPGTSLDTEFGAISNSINGIRTNLALIQADDGGLANGLVGVDQLATELTIGLRSPTAWQTLTEYEENDTVIEANVLYRCTVDHVSGVFATDLAAGKWIEVADYAVFIVDAESAKDEAVAAKDEAVDARDDSEAARDAAESYLDEFTDLYLGAKTSDPVLDNDGDALQPGALYLNTVISQLKFYDGSTWQGVGVNTDETVKVSTGDSAGYLQEKIIGENGIEIKKKTAGGTGQKLVIYADPLSALSTTMFIYNNYI